jgi:hypothetical protein
MMHSYVTDDEQVLHRISGKVDIRRGAVNAAVPLRSERLGRQMHPTSDEIPQDAARFELQDEYEFTEKEVPARSFKPLMQLPHIINNIDVVDGYLADDAVVPVMFDPRSVNAPAPTEQEEAAVASISQAKNSGSISRRTLVSEETIQGVVKAVREDIDSREVEELL